MKNTRLVKKASITLTAAIALTTGSLALTSSQALAESWEPDSDLNVTISFGPGGGNDRLARMLVDIINKYDLYPGNIITTNRAGGSGAVGWGYMYNQEGNPYHVSTTSGSFIATPLQASTPWKPSSFTHIALMAADDQVLVVNSDSEIETFEEYLEIARNHPPVVGGIGSVNSDFMVAQILSELADYEYDYVPFNAAGELTTALLSRSIDALITVPGTVLGLIESGDFRALAFGGEVVPSALEGVPSLHDLGYGDAAVPMPRGLIMPPEVSEEARQWWIDTTKKIVETPEWKEYVEANFLTENVLYGDDFTRFLDRQVEIFETILTEAGAI